MGELLVSLEKTGYRYPDGPMVGPVSLQVRAGERWAVLGANGAGKSTLLLLAAGLLAPSVGTVVRPGMAPGRQVDPTQVAMVFQEPEAQLFSGSVREEVEYGPRQVEPGPQGARRAGEMLEQFGLAHLASRPPQHLSGGERRLLALACMVAVSPRVLLLDEPTADLDPRHRDWLVEYLAEWATPDRALVVATHDLRLARRLCQQALVLGEDGGVAARGAMVELLAKWELLQSVNLVGRSELISWGEGEPWKIT